MTPRRNGLCVKDLSDDVQLLCVWCPVHCRRAPSARKWLRSNGAGL